MNWNISDRSELNALIKESNEYMNSLGPVDRAILNIRQRDSYTRAFIDNPNKSDGTILADEVERLRELIAT